MNDKHIKSSLSAAIGIVVALLFSALLLIPRNAGSESEPRSEARAVVDFGPPLAGGERTTIEAAEGKFPATFFRPQMNLAADDSMKDLWMRLDGDSELYAQYESGIVVTVRSTADVQGTSEYAQAQIKDGVPGSLVDLGSGILAFEVPQSSEGDLGSVRMEIGDAVVVVIGEGDFSPKVLREVARSVVSGVEEQPS